MNNRHLCRGKRLDNGDWAYGYYVTGRDLKSPIYDVPCIRSIGSPNHYAIDPDTVGQCTGLTAAKSYRGTEPEDRLVFEGDILQDNYRKEIVSVWWDEHHLSFVCRGGKVSPTNVPTVVQFAEIIGNIHDHPELLEVDGKRKYYL